MATASPSPLLDQDAGFGEAGDGVVVEAVFGQNFAGVGGELRRGRLHAAGGAGEGLVFTSLYGVYDLTMAARDVNGGTDPDRTLRYDFATGDHPLARPESGAVWVGTAVTHWPDGSESAETAAYVFGREGERQLSGCTYRTIPVKVTFMDDQGWVAQDMLYFADFGLSVTTGRQRVTDRAPRWRALAGLVAVTP